MTEFDDILLAYLYIHYVIFLPMVMHMHMKLVNSFGNWLKATFKVGLQKLKLN